MLNEDALRQFIASLPKLDKEHESDGLGEEEELYIRGVLDAHRVLTGSEPQTVGVINSLQERAQHFRVPHAPEWVSLGPGRGAYCKTCEAKEEEGHVPWHSPMA